MKFEVYKNDKLIGLIPGNKTACKKWIENHVLEKYQGEWIRHADGYWFTTKQGKISFKKIREHGIR